DDGERLVADQRLRHEDRVPEAERLSLTHVRHLNALGDFANFLELLCLATLLQEALELVGDVEMVLDRVLAAAGHYYDVRHPGLHGLLDAILNDGLVHQNQHFLSLCRGGMQETSPQNG